MTCVNDDCGHRYEHLYTSPNMAAEINDWQINVVIKDSHGGVNTTVCLVWAVSTYVRFFGRVNDALSWFKSKRCIYWLFCRLKIVENAPKKCFNWISWINLRVPNLLLGGLSHNPSLNLDSLQAKNEFYYKSNESIKLISS